MPIDGSAEVVSLISGTIGIAMAVTIMVLIRKDHLHVRYGLSWVAAAVAFALLGVFPGIVDTVALQLGIAYPPVLALTIGLSLVVLKVLIMDIERSRNEIKIQRLIQRIALLESDLRDTQVQLLQEHERSKSDGRGDA